MKFETILYAEDGPIGTITLNRPHDGNMFDAQMCHEMRDCINAIRRETRTRVVVITGAGDKAFSAGNDLKYHAELQAKTGKRPHSPPKGFGGLANRQCRQFF